MTVTLSGLNQGAVTVPLPVTAGGTGASTLTGLVKGSGTGALAAAVSGTDIKTVGGASLLGSGDITISTAGSGGRTITGNLTLTVTSGVIADAAISVTPTAPGLYVTLPVATTITTEGVTQISVYNAGDYDYGVKDSAGTQLGWVRPRTGAIIGLADNSTAAGVWAPYGLEKTGITASYVNSTVTNMGGTIRRIALDANRTCFLFGGVDCYAIVYDASTTTWGTATLVRATVASGAFVGVLAATDKVLVCSCSSTTALETVTLSISTNTITVNTGTKVSTTLGGNYSSSVDIGLTAVSTSFVLSIGVGAVGYVIYAITVSGTTPSVGSPSTVGGSASLMKVFASGSIARVVLCFSGAGGISVTPYTVAGTGLTLGTAASATTTAASCRTFLNGNGNIVCHYINTTHFATIFKLTGTVEAASSVSLGAVTAPTNITSHADYVAVSAGKTVFLWDASTTQWWSNILTDTAGTASAGAALASNGGFSGANITNTVGISINGSAARFSVNNSTEQWQILLDCSGTSPSLSSAQKVVYVTSSMAQALSSDAYGVRSPKTTLAGQTLSVFAGNNAQFDTRFTANSIQGVLALSLPLATTLGIGVVGASNETFLAGSPGTSNQGYIITRIEAAA